MLKNRLACWSLVLFSVVGYAQDGPFGYYRDALLFSQSNTIYGSTARMQAIGGAQTALGGDLSTISANPAGLGFFNRSIFAATASLDFIAANTEYLESPEDASKTNFNLPNIGVVFNFSRGDYTNSKFKGSSLGISINRTRSFHVDRSYSAPNNFNSIIDAFIETAGLTPPEELGALEGAAFDQFLIDPVFDANNQFDGYTSVVLGFPIQSETIEERGSQYQLNVAWGGNYDDIFYFGGGLGVQFLNYRIQNSYLESEFVEFDSAGNAFDDPLLNSISLQEELRIRGNGVNFNFGAIVRPVNFVTVGINYTTPTFLALNDESFFDMTTLWREEALSIVGAGNLEINNFSDLFTSRYSLTVPSRLSVGAAVFIGKNGFLSGDIERVNYSSASISSDDFSESSDNERIEALYDRVYNIRVGGEYRFGNLRLRGGYAFLPSPFNNAADPLTDPSLQERTNITFGIGYRTSDYFVDFSVISSETSIRNIPYTVSFEQPFANSEITNTTIAITFGLNF